MSIFGGLDPEKHKEILRQSINIGDVYLKKFEEASHEKLFIIAGISKEKVYVCSVFINSKIHPSVVNKPNIYKLHIPLLKSKNDFLRHDSYANCSYPFPLEVDKITDGVVNSSCKVIGKINKTDLVFIQKAIIESGLLSDDEIALYFS
jgi:hypothetical protein